MKRTFGPSNALITLALLVGLIVWFLPASSLEAQTAASGWTLSVHATNVSTLDVHPTVQGEALAPDLATGDLFVKSLLDPVSGNGVRISRISLAGGVTALADFPALRNSNFSGIAIDPLGGGIIVADEAGQRIALVNPATSAVATVFNVPWVMNPLSNGSGQQQYATDPGNPNILYFYDNTVAKVFRLDRSTNATTELLALDPGVSNGAHAADGGDIVFDAAAGKLLVSQFLSSRVFEIDPDTSPATVVTLFSVLPIAPRAIALNPSTDEVFLADFNSIAVGPRVGGSVSAIAAGFPFLVDLVVGTATTGAGLSLFSLDTTQDTVYEITPSAAVNFAAFAAKVEIEAGEFEVKALFTLGGGSNGIDPLTEDVSLQIGAFSTTIPAGNFMQDKKGRFKFEGVVDGVVMEAVIQPLGGGSFEFKAEGSGVDFTGTVNPVTVGLVIGNDSGTTVVIAEFE